MTKKGVIILSVFILLIGPLFAQLKYANLLFDEQNYREAIPLYERVLEKKGESVEVLEKLAYCYKVINDYDNAEKYFAKAVTFDEADASSYLYYGQLLKNSNKINQARAQFIKFSEKKPGSLIGKLMIRSCDDIKIWSSQPVEFNINNLKEINSEYNDIGPFPYKNGLIFTSEKNHTPSAEEAGKKKTGENPNFSIFFIPYENDEPGTITPLFSKASNDDYEGPAYLNKNEDLIYFNKVFDTRRFLVNQIKIYYSKYQNGAWGAPKSFFLNSNEYTITNPVLSPSGDTIYFASDKEGGYGGMDIYYCVKRGEDEWSKAVNLGPLVNTEGIEIPSYVDDKGVLYLSSNFHPGYGGFDVFKTTWNGTTWSNPENLKSPLNSTKDELGFILVNSKEGYFSSNRDGGSGKDDIYRFTFMDTSDLSNYTTVSGIFEYKNLPLENITLNLLDENDVLIQSAVTNNKGEFKFKGIPPNMNYQIIVDEPDDQIPDGTKLYLTNSENKKVKLLTQIRKGLFKFEALKIDEYDDLPPIDEPEDDEVQRLNILGEVYNKLSLDLPANMEVYLLDDDGNVISTAKTDEHGKFQFNNLKLSEEFLFRLSEKDPDLELNILNARNELIAATSRNENGDFVYLTNLQKSVKNPDVAGVFKYGKLPASDVKLNLMDENDELVQFTKTNEQGEFTFTNLEAGKDYSIKIDPTAGKIPKNATMYLKDAETGRLLPVAKNGKGTFNFKTLAYDEAPGLSLMEENDDDSPRMNLLGEVYNRLSLDLPENMEVYLLDDNGNIVATAVSGKNGRFGFTNIQKNDEFFFRLSSNDPNLELKIINRQGQLISTTSRNDNGDFVYYTNLQKSVKNPDVAGVFKYGKLPAQDVKLNLMDENDELIQYTKTDEKGEFTFTHLEAGRNYAVKVDPSAGPVPANAEMFLRDKQTGRLLPVAKNGNGTFEFQTLAYDEAEDLPLMEEPKDDGPKTNLLGEVYHKLSMDIPENMEVYLLDDNGNIVATATTGKDGRFSFKNVTDSEEFFFRLSKNDPNLEIKIINQQGQLLGTTSRNNNGDFVYYTNLQKSVKNPDVAGVFKYGKLPAQDVKLNLMDENDEMVQFTTTNSNGEFLFKNLKAGKNYAVKVDASAGEVPANAEMFLRDKQTGRLLPVAKNGNGTFEFQTLAYDEPEELPLLTTDDEKPLHRFLTQMNYEKLPLDLPEGMEVFLVDDNGNIISKAIVNRYHRFKFEKMELDDEELLLMMEKDPKLSLKIVTEDGEVIAVLSRNSKGELTYDPVKTKNISSVNAAAGNLSASGTTIYYEFSSWELSAEAIEKLDRVVLTLRDNQRLNVVINTHTDSRGDNDFNIWLGNRRASVIVQYLILEGVDFERISFKSFGESRLVNDCGNSQTCTDAQHAKNRRAEFEFVSR